MGGGYGSNDPLIWRGQIAMSEYPRMERCIICRTEFLWKEYKETHRGDGFELTLAISFLTMLLSRFDGMHEEYAIRPPYAQLATELKKCASVAYYPEGSDRAAELNVSDKDLIHLLRNGFAHIHIEGLNKDGYIDKLYIKSRNESCRYEYEFTASDLCIFLEATMRILLGFLDQGGRYCQECKYYKKEAAYSTHDC